MESEQKIKIIIADDHPIFRNGLRQVLKGMPFAGQITEAANGDEVLKLLGYEAFQLVLMDIKMSPMDGIKATELVTKNYPATKVIALSMFDDKKIVLDMVSKGASGFLLKNANSNEIKNAILEVMEGGTYFSKDISEILLKQATDLLHSADDGAKETLTEERTREVIFLICYEFNNIEIGNAIFISDRSVERYKTQIYKLTKNKASSGIMKYAIFHGIFNDEHLKLKFARAIEKKKNG